MKFSIFVDSISIDHESSEKHNKGMPKDDHDVLYDVQLTISINDEESITVILPEFTGKSFNLLNKFKLELGEDFE